MRDAAFQIAIALCVVVNILWYRAKFIVRRHGYPMSLFWGHFRDLKNLAQIAAEEESIPFKRGCYLLLGAIILGFILFIIAGAIGVKAA
jgi:hypothetical protein